MATAVTVTRVAGGPIQTRSDASDTEFRMNERQKTSLVTRALQGVWAIAPIPVGWLLITASTHMNANTSSFAAIAAQALLAAVWAAGLVAVFRLRPALHPLPRLAGATATVWGAISIVAGVSTPAAALMTWGLVTMILAASRQVLDDSAQRLTAAHERRLTLATPLGLTIGMVLPASLLAGYGAGLVPALLIGFRPEGWQLAISVAGLAALFAVTISLSRMARRWLVVVPAGVVIHDPLILEEAYRIRPDELAWAELGPRRWRRIAAEDSGAKLTDVTGGCASSPVILVLTKEMAGPMLRSGRGRAAKNTNMIACRPGNRALALEALRAAGFERVEPTAARA